MKQDPVLLAAQQFIQSNQDKIPNAPWVKPAIDAIMNGDVQSGINIANNLCSSFGTTRNNAVAQAINFFTGKR